MRLSPREQRLIGLAVILGLGFAAYRYIDWPPPLRSPTQLARAAELRGYARALQPLATKKIPPEVGDWLEVYPEPGQTFNEYLWSEPPGPTAERTTLYVRILGEFGPQQMQVLADAEAFMAAYFGLPVKRLDPLALSGFAATDGRFHPDDFHPQLRTGPILDRLKLELPPDAVALIAFTPVDLYPEPDWNFVFGQASLSDRVGVWSLARFGDPRREYATVLRRTCHIAAHETGHMFGIRHCTAFECVMNGANTLEEMDRSPLEPCPQCSMKLWWINGLNARARYTALAEWGTGHQLPEEAVRWQSCLSALD